MVWQMIQANSHACSCVNIGKYIRFTKYLHPI
uniref:Uncharacterized protein n=1 Tax=Arundo donax TaxID=35708 RepID=A0A0A9C679_ARUDO